MKSCNELKKEMLDKKTWAVVGASVNKDKYGYKVWKKLEQLEYETYPINPNYKEIDGQRCYKSLNELPKKPDVINFIIPPTAILDLLPIAKEMGVQYLWCQPGAANEEVVLKAKELGFIIAYNVCVLVELG
ncbi:CoA-binding protein [Proteiniborus sp.]|uniref:CoA-binding protein n=1 Tax=Proteiniborus sp. TaxID=2079015 RepID=UPI003319705A